MPDPTRQTISATESPALLNASPYLTRWMLWQRFANGREFEREADERMTWGNEMQPIICKHVARDRKLEVIPNVATYVRRDQLGCTRDATIIDPDRGPGALEIKCVFDYKIWMTKWRGGEFVPREIEIQLQQQMYVGDGSTPGVMTSAEFHESSYRWGLIAVWVCADLYYFERKPIEPLWTKIRNEADVFFDSVRHREEPDPFGAAIELPLLAELYPTVPEKILDLSDDPDHVATSEKLSMFQTLKETATGNARGAEELRNWFLALAKDNEQVKLPCGFNFRVKKSGRGRTIDPYIPEVPTAAPAPRDPVGIL